MYGDRPGADAELEAQWTGGKLRGHWGGASRGEVFTIAGWDENKRWVQVNTVAGAAWMAARYTTLSGNCNGGASGHDEPHCWY